MLEGYKNGRKLNRAKVCIDIKNRKVLFDGVIKLLSEIDQEVSEENLDSPYINNACAEKISKGSGEKDHLDGLVAMASSGECFNANYLFYLAGVATKPKGKGLKSKLRLFAISFAVIIVVLAIAFASGFIVTGNHYSDVIARLDTEKAGEIANIKAEKKQIEEEKESVSKKLKKAEGDYAELLKLSPGQFLVRQVLSGTDDGMLSEALEKRRYTAKEIYDIAANMELPEEEMEQIRDRLGLDEKKID